MTPAGASDESAGPAAPMPIEALAAAFDWSLVGGPPRTWSQSLQAAFDICMTSRFPMILLRGRDLVQFYNDGYAALIGPRHPAAFGQTAQRCWSDIWDTIGPMLHRVLDTSEATWSEDLYLPLERGGIVEERYFTFSYSPVREGATVVGVFCAVNETTAKIRQERGMRDSLKALQEFRAVADNVSHIVFTHRPDGSIEWANQRWYDLTQLPPEIATTPQGWQQVTSRDDYAAVLASLERAFATGQPYEFEVRLKAANAPESAYRWHRLHAVPMRQADGTIARWAGTATDIHDRRNAELQRDQEFRALSEALPTIVWTATADGAGDYFNRHLTEYSGLAMEDAVGSGWLKLVHEEDAPRAAAVWRHSLETGAPYEVTYRLRRKDGEYRWFEARGSPNFNAAGEIVRWIGTCTDVDDAKRRYERERRASEAFQEAALPQNLPRVPGLLFSAVYRAGSAEALVGGDWYDAFRLTDGRLVLSVGDVMGSGLRAAVTMSSVRQAIRGAAQIYPEPCAVLDAADRALRSENPDAIVTAFVAILDPVTHTMTFASAGHPAPFLRDRSGTISELHGSGLPLGLRPHMRGETARVIVIAEPALLVLYTDGLTEATRDIAEGEARLRRAMDTDDVLTAPNAARAIASASLDEVYDDVHDDVAILAVRFDAVGAKYAPADDDGGAPAIWEFDSADDAAAGAARAAIAAELRQRDVADSDIAVAELLFSELVGNVMRHTGGAVEIALDLSAAAPVLHVLDRGPGFLFSARLPANPLSESGRGLYIAAMLARDLNVVPRADGGSHARVVLPFDVPAKTARRPFAGTVAPTERAGRR